jgi:hypothetical protein
MSSHSGYYTEEGGRHNLFGQWSVQLNLTFANITFRSIVAHTTALFKCNVKKGEELSEENT